MAYESLGTLRTTAFRNLGLDLENDATDRIPLDMDLTGNTTLPNLAFPDQFLFARQTLSSIYEDTTLPFDIEADADVTADFTQAHLPLLLDDDPGWKATEALFGDFLRYLLLYQGQDQVFELLRQFENLCLDQITILRKIIERGAPGKQKFIRTVEMLRFMELELWTWRLIRMLYGDRLDKERENKVASIGEKEVRLMTDLEKWNFLYDSDRQFREMQLIVKWCQQNATDLLDIQSHTCLFEGKTFLWENTLHNLKTKRQSTRKSVQHLDPDAPLRENAQLDDADEADEQRLLMFVFCYIRAGQLQAAIDLCVQCGQEWRAALLASALPYFGRDEGPLGKEAVGNASRDVWKCTAWKFCENPSVPAIERAIFGSLSGHFSSVRSSCATWEDTLWAHATAASEHTFDQFIRKTASGKRKIAELPRTSSENLEAISLTIDEICENLKACDDEIISSESKNILRHLQALILTGQPDQAVLSMHQYLLDHGDEAPAHLVRVMAHIVLVFNLCSLEIPTTFANGVIEHYVKALIDGQRKDLVVHYAASLSPDLQQLWYARLLQDVDGKEERLHFLSLAEGAGINGPFVCLRVADNIKAAFEPYMETEQSFLSSASATDGVDNVTSVVTATTAGVSERDTRLISAIEWLLFYRKLHGEAIRQTNVIARIFLVGRNLSAAVKLFESLPVDILRTATEAWLSTTYADDDIELRQLSLEHQNSIREFRCHKTYLDAHNAFLRWFEHYHRKKPQIELSSAGDVGLSSAASFRLKLSREVEEKKYQESLANWKRNVDSLAEVAVQAAHEVLLYPDGWMVDQTASESNAMDVAEDPIEPDRIEELSTLRSRCLPLITDMLISVLQSMGRYREALQVADIIAVEEHCLYQVFTKDQLKLLTKRLASISAEAMNGGMDCLGE